VVAAAYALVNQWNGWRGVTVWDPATAWDLRIPPWPPALAVYATHLLYFPLLPLTCPPGARAHEAAARTLQALGWVTLVSLACFFALPCEIHVRDAMRAAVTGSGWRPLYELTWQLDAPYNAWPSLHVSLTAVFAAWAARGRGALVGGALLVGWCALAASIVLTKQHFLLDLVSGSALGALAWALLAPGWRRLLDDQK
jgi:membrane-associated phospholipid phosphatase